MKKILIYSIFILSMTYFSFSRNNVNIKLYINNTNGNVFQNLTFGLSDTATDYFDPKIEKEYPPFPPPEGNLVYFALVDSSTKENIYSIVDYKGTYGKNILEKTYHFVMLGKAEYDYTISWDNLPAQVVSAQIYDSLGGVIVNANMKTKSSVMINKFLFDVYLNLKYDLSKTIVEEDLNPISIFPNPTKNTLNIINCDNSKIELYNELGELILNNVTNVQINIENQPSGIYYLKIFQNNVVSFKKIIKI